MAETSLEAERVPTWEATLELGIDAMLDSRELGIAQTIDASHLEKTPKRVVKAYKEIFAGCLQDPKDALSTLFKSNSKQMVHVKDVTFYSTCAHHLLTFWGTASFAYIPNGQVVGLSKIPRLIEVFSRRPQVQEELTDQIVDSFYSIVKPLGCALMMRAYHLCCMSRGIKQPTSYTETTALAGNFFEPSVKQEFLQSVASSHVVWR